MLLRARTESEYGLLLEAPTVDPPEWCRFHDLNGQPYEHMDYAAEQKKYQRHLRCEAKALRTVAELDEWLYSEEPANGVA